MSIVATTHQERGAITIHVAIALTALIAFSAFVVDYGRDVGQPPAGAEFG